MHDRALDRDAAGSSSAACEDAQRKMSPVSPSISADGLVLSHLAGSVATITLNRPAQRNPLDWATIKRLGQLVRQFEGDPAVQIVVVRGAGGHFSAGGDLKGYIDLYRDADAFRQFLVDFHAMLDAIEASSRVYVAVVEGYCVAGGLELLLACDIVLAAETAKIGDAHIGFGQLPGAGGSQRLPRVVGAMRARYLMLTGELWTAVEAEQSGLVSKVVPDAQLDAQVGALVARLSQASPLGREGMKHLTRLATTTNLAEGLRMELEYVWRYATTSVDATEGLAAFSEKRKPRFTGS
jgi:enoyl-CoA hydratase/carnithine racemase